MRGLKSATFEEETTKLVEQVREWHRRWTGTERPR